MQSFLIPFISIIVAEFLDKSQISILLLASRTTKRISLFFGAMLAFVVVDGLAIILGSFITSLIPSRLLHLLAGIVFLIFGLIALRKHEEQEKTVIKPLHNVFVSSFSLVFLSELGDKTQLATALYATQFQPFLVFLGVMSAFTLLTLLAVFAGGEIGKRVKKHVLSLVTGIIFVCLGIFFMVMGLR